MVKKKLAICGCSYMTSSYNLWEQLRGVNWPDYPVINDIKKFDLTETIIEELDNRGYKHNYSFIDSYAKEKNFESIYLAQPGASNFFIRLQIDQAINRKADYIIIGASDANRFEIPADSLDIEDTRKFNSKKYIMSTQFDDSIKSLTDNLISAVKYYKSYLQDFNINNTKSYYILQDGLTQLEKKKIPYVFIPGPMRYQDWTQNNIIWPTDEYQPWDMQHGKDSRYNHNNEKSHNDYLNTLLKITSEWE